MTKEKKIFQPLQSESICQIYNLLRSEGVVAFPVTEEAIHKIESLVGNVVGSYFGSENYPSVELKVVAYLYFLIKDHPFTDGNKRTAVLTFLVLCDLNDIRPNMVGFGLDTLAVFIEQSKRKNHQKFIADIADLLFFKEEAYWEE